MLTTADKLKKGRFAFVVSVDCNKFLKKRLYAMGVIPGTEVVFVRSAPLGDPLLFMVRDYRIAIRRSDAKDIKVEYNKAKWYKRLFV